MILYLISQIFVKYLELLYGVYAIFIVSFFIYCAIMSNRSCVNRLIIYASIKFWGALCLFLVSNLTIRRVGVTDGIRTVFRYAGMVPGYKNSFRYTHVLLDMEERQQVVTDLFVLAFFPARMWYRILMNIWIMNMNWIFSLFNMALNTDLII